MARSAKPRKRKPAPQRSKLPRYVVKLHDDDFLTKKTQKFCALIIFTMLLSAAQTWVFRSLWTPETKSWSSGLCALMTKDIRKLLAVRSGNLRPFSPVSAPAACTVRSAVRFTGRTVYPRSSDVSPFRRYFSAGKLLA